MSSTERTWTEAQRAAIDARGGEIVVSAGAGSGKTAVLVERVIGLVLDPAAPVDLERILVVTFTEEAANEMRRRIRAAIEERLERGPSKHLEAQLALLERAQISTIHSFCRRLILEGFHLLGLDPQAEVMEEEEARLLQLETLEELFEARYGGDDEAARAFADLAERYGGRAGDLGLRDAVLGLHELLETTFDPEAWLAAALERYRRPELWVEAWRKRLREDLEGLLPALQAGARRLAACGMKEAYSSIAHDETNRLEAILNDLRNAPLAEAFEGVAGWKLERLPGGKQTDEQKAASAAYREARDALKSLLRSASAYQPEAVRASVERARPHAEALCALAADFRAAYSEAKAREGLLDFHDLERFALRLLRGEDGGPSPTARALRERFEHVVVDECQDVNPLQDAILAFVSRYAEPNRFLVGDVKQCIYGFRHAEPRLFLEKIWAGAGNAEC
ncbi:MAG: UvrD-helicase domain-containing protein [Candidatus Sumerlaeota bacterium]|nr:UvrD-helicase domain-containing protein [Candidatus Sumerlaeota bacterium]